MKLVTLASLVCLPAFAAVASFGCETYDSPPRTEIVGLSDKGVLADPTKSIVLQFSEPVQPKTLKLKVVPLVTDLEGRLGDEDDDEATPLGEFFAYDGTQPDADIERGTAFLSTDGRSIEITLQETLPVGPSLAVLVEPGLSDAEGNATEVRQRLLFGYEFSCDDAGATDAFPSGVYFILLDVETPIATQVQLWADIDVDPGTGAFIGQFTNADRNPDPGRCSPACDASSACRLLPAQECVVPSTKAGTEDEYPDFVPNVTPPTGYSFAVQGCVAADGDRVRFANLAADVDIQLPDIFIKGIEIVASFGTDAEGVFRGTGAGTAEQVFLGITPSGAARGTVVARFVPEDEVPPDVPPPAPAEP
jgi:hypothetical protein